MARLLPLPSRLLDLLFGEACVSCREPCDPFARVRALCRACCDAVLHDEGGIAALEYGGPIRDFIHAWKYGGRSDLSRDAACLLVASDAFRAAMSRSPNLLVPVPIHPSKLVARGYHVVSLLALKVAREARAKRMGPPLRLDVTSFVRTRDGPPQASLPRAERKENVAGAFLVKRKARIVGQHVLLLDDVCTTRATIEAATAALLTGGAASVHSLAFAHRGKI